MKTSEILKEAIKKNKIAATKINSFSNKIYKEKAKDLNVDICEINNAYALSAQDAWKYSVQ